MRRMVKHLFCMVGSAVAIYICIMDNSDFEVNVIFDDYRKVFSRNVNEMLIILLLLFEELSLTLWGTHKG